MKQIVFFYPGIGSWDILSRCQVWFTNHPILDEVNVWYLIKKKISPGGQDDDSGLQLFRLQQQGS